MSRPPEYSSYGFYPASSSNTQGTGQNPSPPPPPPPPPPGSFVHQQQFLYNYSNASQPPRPPYSYLNAPQLPVHSQTSEVRKRPREEETPQWKCEPCKLSLESEGALKAHLNSHETCSACSFSGAPKVVKGHFQSVHGKFSGGGFKAITVAIPGCQVQRFRICVGNRPEDVEKWIEDRRKRFPRMAKDAADSQAPSGDRKEEVQGLSSLLDGYGSSSSEDDKGTTEKKAPVESSVIKEPSDTVKDNRRPCHYFARNGTCRNGDRCSYSHAVANATTQIPSDKRRQQQQQQHKLGKKKGHSYLLRKLFVNDVRRETTLTLQLLEYLVDSDFLQKPVSGNIGSS